MKKWRVKFWFFGTLFLCLTLLVALVYMGHHYRSIGNYLYCAAIMWGFISISLIRLTRAHAWMNFWGILWNTAYVLLFFLLVLISLFVQRPIRDFLLLAALIWTVILISLLPSTAYKSMFVFAPKQNALVKILQKDTETIHITLPETVVDDCYRFLFLEFPDGSIKKVMVKSKVYFKAKENEIRNFVYKEKDSAILFIRFED